jgi:hypothetical protein
MERPGLLPPPLWGRAGVGAAAGDDFAFCPL